MSTTKENDHKSSGAPWQYGWKRPRWHVVQDVPLATGEETPRKENNNNNKQSNKDAVEGTCLGVASARVSHDEVPDLVADKEGAAANKQQQQRSSSLVLTVTVIASPFRSASSSSSSYESSVASPTADATTIKSNSSSSSSSTGDTLKSSSNTSQSGDLLVLEILRQPGLTGGDAEVNPEQQPNEDSDNNSQEPQRLFTKVLRWPGVALQDSSSNRDKNGEPQSWRQNLPLWLGGVSSSSHPAGAPSSSSSSSSPSSPSSSCDQSVGVVAACLCRRLMNTDVQRAAALDALDTMTFLSLGMGPEVRTANIKDNNKDATLEPDDNTSIREEEEEGDENPVTLPELVLACLCSDGSVHVYSPWKLLQLPSSSAKTEEENQEDLFSNSMSAFLLGEYIFEQLKYNIWPLSQPEATVQLTVPMRKRGQLSTPSGADNDKKGAGDSSDEDNRKTEGVSFWDRSVWDPTVDPFTAIYRTENNIPTHCISAFEYIVIAGRGQRAKGRKGKRGKSGKEGGFMTLLSLRHYSEIRTLFLPFAPTSLSPFAWGGMQFLFVLGGKGVAVAIRIDMAVSNSIICGEAPSVSASNDLSDPPFPRVTSDSSLVSHQSTRSKTQERKKQKKSRCILHRFQILPIVLPDIVAEDMQALSVAMSTLFGSSRSASPPKIAMVCRSPTQGMIVMQQHALVSIDFTRHTSSSAPSFKLFRGYRRSRDRRILAIGTSHESRHVATLNLAVRDSGGTLDEAKEELAPVENSEWCHLGQGWCLIGMSGRVYFVCWDGATSQGAFVQELPMMSLSNEQARGFISEILPENPYEMQTTRFRQKTNLVEDLAPPFTQDAAARDSIISRLVSDTRGTNISDLTSMVAVNHNGTDDVVKDAIRSILNTEPGSPNMQNRKVRRYSRQEKSARLLSRVPVWSQLDDAAQNKVRLEGQVPVVYVRLQHQLASPCLLTVRHIYADNGIATPFHQIISWLSTNKDYFTAASVALDLLFDKGTLLNLWNSFEKIEKEDERAIREGLLDGIVPICDRLSRVDTGDPFVQATVTQLADMTVGCLTRGGFAMSSTLEYFLKHDIHYDASRTCLILAAIATQAACDDTAVMVSLMGESYEVPDDQDQLIHDILWPLRCLLQVGTSRGALPAALALANATAPDELRGRGHHKQVNSMKLCRALVKLIIGTSPNATSLLLDLVDEEEQKRFWYSLENKTQLELALILINDTRPLLRELEVRSWAMLYLQRCLNESAGRNFDAVPTGWLKSLCTACLANAQCDIAAILSASDTDAKNTCDDGVKEHVMELTLARDALVAGHQSGGVDFNLLIPALLLLEIRDAQWNDKSWVPTQSILNAACDMAGRKTAEEPMFPFDGNALMKHCFLAENICAGANLIGGKNGLIVECCSILIDCCNMTMKTAESFLLRDSMDVDAGGMVSSESEKVCDEFELSYGHRHVLWLLEEHVLEVRTYGEFDAARGKVDPVFAARVCLRTWLGLTKSQLSSASAWLASWLRQQLEMGDESVSRKRLACATLARVLLWSAGLDEGEVLAEKMRIESQFLVQLSQGCWSLTESIPPSVADELLAQDAVDGTLG